MKKFILVRRDTMEIVSPEEFDSFDEARIERHKMEIANPDIIIDIMITDKCEHPSNDKEYYKKIYDARVAAKAKLPQSREEFEERKQKVDKSMFETYGVQKAKDILSRPGCTDGAISSRGFDKKERR